MRPKHWLAFAALCLVSGSRWLVTDSLPSTLPFNLQQTLHFSLLALVFALLSRKHLRIVLLKPLILPAILFFALPILASSLADGEIASTTQAVLFTLLPSIVILAIAQQATSFGVELDTRRLLVPAVAGALGALLLIPYALPSSRSGIMLFAFLIAAEIGAALAAIRLHRVLTTMHLLSAATVVCLLCAAVLATGIHGAVFATPSALIPEAALAVALDAPLLLLTLWLLRELSPIRFASRYILIPLVSIIEGLLLVRPHLSVTTCAGILLMAVGGAALLLATD